MNKNFQLIIPVAGPNDEFNNYKNHKLLIDIYDKKLIEWIQISRPYNLSKGIFIFQKTTKKNINYLIKFQNY